MQSKAASLAGRAADREDVAAYIATMSRQLAEVCVLAGMDEAARLLEDAAALAHADQESAG